MQQISKTLISIGKAKRAVRFARTNQSGDAQSAGFNMDRAKKYSQGYWNQLGLEQHKQQIKSALNTSAEPGTDQFYSAVAAYQKANPETQYVDGILGPLTLSSLQKHSKELASTLSTSQAKASTSDSPNVEDFKNKLGQIESGGRYDIVNPHTPATGKYQFMWNLWANPISEFAGRSVSQQEFLNSPKLQEQFMTYYTKNNLIPSASRLKRKYPEATSKLTFNQLMGLVHFKGEGDGAKILAGQPDPTTQYNSSVQDYLSRLI